MHTQEKWAAVAGFPGYEVSYRGEVRDESGRLLRQSISRRGNRIVSLRIDGKYRSRTTRTVRRLVSAAFLPPFDPALGRLYHIDGDRLNCSASNLEIRPLRNIYQRGSKFVARPKVGGERKYLGTFATLQEAEQCVFVALSNVSA